MKLFTVFLTTSFMFLSLVTLVAKADAVKLKKKAHFTRGKYKIDTSPYKVISADEKLVFRGNRKQIFEIEAIKTKDLIFYTLTVSRGNTQVLKINDFAISSSSSKLAMRKEAWIEDLNGDGYFDIIQREKTQIVSKRRPTSVYKNDKMVLKMWDPDLNLFVNLDKNSKKFEQSLKKFNFKLNLGRNK
ncbi:MAG: hypothetical protein L6Q37_06270 [Bdellovibrionaceae bacterium]|nr:hypothetical protein [Pseudobdellovibrionaceae bacterium]NUM57412.1 hypothetical protein [Pseudobdellovibrionaceae bacterium]